jgi:hypothetical protein
MLQALQPLDIVSIVQPGDVLAFSGQGNVVSDIIRAVTGSIVSHVGLILSSQSTIDNRLSSIEGKQPQLIESVAVGGFKGVTVTNLIDRCIYYPGLIWYLPLRADLQKKVDSKKLDYWLVQQEGKRYDAWGAIESALLQWEQSDYWHKIQSIVDSRLSIVDKKNQIRPSTIDHLPSHSDWFCSELASAALQQVGILPQSMNPDLIRPTDLVAMEIYSGTYYQIKGWQNKGDRSVIPEYNTKAIGY